MMPHFLKGPVILAPANSIVIGQYLFRIDWLENFDVTNYSEL